MQEVLLMARLVWLIFDMLYATQEEEQTKGEKDVYSTNNEKQDIQLLF